MFSCWQDYAIALIQLGLTASIVPMVLRGPYPPLTSSVPTVFGLSALAGVMATLNLWVACATLVVSALLWAVLVIKRQRQLNK